MLTEEELAERARIAEERREAIARQRAAKAAAKAAEKAEKQQRKEAEKLAREVKRQMARSVRTQRAGATSMKARAAAARREGRRARGTAVETRRLYEFQGMEEEQYDAEDELVSGGGDQPLARAKTAGRKTTLTFDARESDGFEDWLIENLTQIHRDWSKTREE